MNRLNRSDPADSLVEELRELRAKHRLVASNLHFLEKQYPKSVQIIRKLQDELSQLKQTIASKEQALKNLGYR